MSGPGLVVDGWQVDVLGLQLTQGDIRRRLEPKAMHVLVALAARPDGVVSRAELLDEVWGGAYVGDDAVSAAVIKLRRAFDDDARSPRVIETVHKSGYRLIAEVGVGRVPPVDPPTDKPAAQPQQTVKLATLLRCNIHIESDRSPSLSPERWRQSTDAFAGALDRIIRRHGGEPIRESTATLGVFGAPVAQEHHAMRAVQAAIEIRESAVTGAPDGLRLTWQIALASGEILFGSSASEAGQMIHGAPVQRVTSLAGAALPGEVLLAPETRELALGLLGARRGEPRSHAVGIGECYRLDEDARWNSPWEARVERGLTPLFGRDHEVGRVDDLLGAAAGGHGRVVAVSGEPGAGKSRLVHETLLLAATHGYATFVATASPLEGRTPFFPVREVIVDRLQLDPGGLVDEATLSAFLERAEPGTRSDTEALLAVLRPAGRNTDWMAIDPEIRRSRSLAALVDVLDDDERPTLVVFEDLHWMDEATLQLIDVIVTQIARRPCVVLLTYRPDFVDPWVAKSYHTLLRIDALSASCSAQMIDHLVGDHPTVERWKSVAIGRAGGTPLFIEEVVRSGRASGTLTGESGGLQLVGASSQSSVPASVHTLVADRIDRLSDGAREILSLAAVIGLDVPAALLDSLIPGTLSDRSGDLDELQAAELLFESRYQRQPGYVFKHALTQEVAYSEIPHSVRRRHHRSVADLLVVSVAEHALVSPELLARHHSGADQHGPAIEAWVRAADLAIAASAFSDALDHLDRARSSLAQTPTGDRDQLELSIELSAAIALVQSAGPAEQVVEDAYRRARVLAASSGTGRQQYEAAWGLWFVHLMRGQINIARQLGDELFELAVGLGDEALQLEAHHVQWSGLSLAGQPMEVRHHAEIGIESYRPEDHHRLTFSYGGHDPGVCSRNLDAMALWLLGQPDLARERSAAGVTLAEQLAHPYTRLESFNSALNIALLDGDADALVRHAEVLYRLVDDGVLPDVAACYADGFRANALALRGDVTAALTLMRSVAAAWQEFWGAWCFPLDSALATALALAGHTDEAHELVEQRLALAEESGAHWWDAEFQRVHGELLRTHTTPDLTAAEDAIQGALDTAHRQGAHFLELRAATSLASLWRDTDRPARALELLTATCGRFGAGDVMTDLHTARRLCDTLAADTVR
jgi:DNA-binding winged helix-turn-helix (wHTH) protein/predicted ATPase